MGKQFGPITKEEAMADSPTVVTTPYPTIMSGGNDDDSFKAALISHTGASVERNQDAQFASLSRQQLNRDVKDSRRETVEAKFDLVVNQKNSEIRAAERHTELAKELAALRAEMQSNSIAQLRVELGESKADSRQQRTESLLAAIVAKLTTT